MSGRYGEVGGWLSTRGWQPQQDRSGKTPKGAGIGSRWLCRRPWPSKDFRRRIGLLADGRSWKPQFTVTLGPPRPRFLRSGRAPTTIAAPRVSSPFPARSSQVVGFKALSFQPHLPAISPNLLSCPCRPALEDANVPQSAFPGQQTGNVGFAERERAPNRTQSADFPERENARFPMQKRPKESH